MRPISVHVSEETYSELRVLAVRSGRPVAALIRQAMTDYVEKARQEGQSILDIAPRPSGRLLRPWRRADIQDEMFGR